MNDSLIIGKNSYQEKVLQSISFESASTFDLDVDIKISVDGNSAINQNGIPYNAPISFKVPKKQAQEAREIVKLVKKHYLCRYCLLYTSPSPRDAQ